MRGTSTPQPQQPTPSSGTRLRERETGENFPVVLAALPRRHRDALHAVYAFARTVDEAGDSHRGDRVAHLHSLDASVTRAWAGERADDGIFADLQRTVTGRVPERYFHDLVGANLQDQEVSRYATFEELRGYCRLSADPVGRIVLSVFDQHDETNAALSDQVCTALQLLEHWQDVAEDRCAGRVYLPQEDLRRFGVRETDLDRPSASPDLSAMMRFEIDRAERLLTDGAPLVRRLHGWARPCVAGYVAGGLATAAALRRTGGDVLGRTARPSRARTAAGMMRLLVAGRPGRSSRSGRWGR